MDLRGAQMSKEETPPGKPVEKTQFDPAQTAELQVAASKKLLALLKAKQEANNASSSREFAVRCVRGLEATIHRLLDIGANTQEVLSQLIEALPSIPADDLRYALKAIGNRNKRLRVSSRSSAPSADAGSTSKGVGRSHVPKETKPKSQPRAATLTGALPAWADGTDKRADETDEDYRFRKEIEGPPEARNKFIGEHKT
jgi:hypothetical protein